MKYVFHPEALTEYAEAVQYYVEQRAEVAQTFVNAIEDAIYRIREFPNRYAAIDGDVRRCAVRRVPYGVLYTIEPDYILIIAVMHYSRKPGYWKNRR
jgi:toxin ParE1/3/4